MKTDRRVRLAMDLLAMGLTDDSDGERLRLLTFQILDGEHDNVISGLFRELRIERSRGNGADF